MLSITDNELRPGETFRAVTPADVGSDAIAYAAQYSCTLEEAIDDMDWPVPSELRGEAILWALRANRKFRADYNPSVYGITQKSLSGDEITEDNGFEPDDVTKVLSLKVDEQVEVHGMVGWEVRLTRLA